MSRKQRHTCAPCLKWFPYCMHNFVYYQLIFMIFGSHDSFECQIDGVQSGDDDRVSSRWRDCSLLQAGAGLPPSWNLHHVRSVSAALQWLLQRHFMQRDRRPEKWSWLPMIPGLTFTVVSHLSSIETRKYVNVCKWNSLDLIANRYLIFIFKCAQDIKVEIVSRSHSLTLQNPFSLMKDSTIDDFWCAHA